MSQLRFEVIGTPVPKGSMRGFVVKGRAILTHANSKTRPFQEAVMWAAREEMASVAWQQLAGPVALELAFYVPRPKSAPKAVTVPIKKPDLDKLTRLIMDAMTRSGAYVDDSQVVSLTACKRFAAGVLDGPGGLPRVVVTVSDAR